MHLIKNFLIIFFIILLSSSMLMGEERLTPNNVSSTDATSDTYDKAPLGIYHRYGIGAKASLGTSSGSAIYFPIMISPTFQYEPEFQHQKTTISERVSNGNSTLSNLEYITEWVSIGVGLLKRRREAELSINSGIRFGLIRAVQYNQSNGTTIDLQGWGYYVSPLLAGEYYISPNLSLTGEAQYRLTAVKMTGEMTTSSTSGNKTYKVSSDRLDLESRFLFILKWYFS